MVRYNLVQARGGDYTFGTEGVAAEGEGKDVVKMGVRQGTISVFVPANLPDCEACQSDRLNEHACLELELEDGTRVSAWVRDGQAYFQFD